jgi:hypothetical protein
MNSLTGLRRAQRHKPQSCVEPRWPRAPRRLRLLSNELPFLCSSDAAGVDVVLVCTRLLVLELTIKYEGSHDDDRQRQLKRVDGLMSR